MKGERKYFNTSGTSANKIFQSTDGITDKIRIYSYINFAHGDEALETVYGSGERLERLKRIKKEYAPNNVFGSFFPII